MKKTGKVVAQHHEDEAHHYKYQIVAGGLPMALQAQTLSSFFWSIYYAFMMNWPIGSYIWFPLKIFTDITGFG